LSDPDAFKESNTWTIFYSKAVAPQEPDKSTLFKATCTTPNGTFTTDTSFSGNYGNISSTIKIGDTWYVYGVSEGIKVSTYNPSTNQLNYIKVAIPGAVADPSVIQLSTNSFKMYYKSAGNTYCADSSDGLNWEAGTLVASNAEVPGAIYVGGKIYLYYVNSAQDANQGKILVRISSDNGATFSSPQVVTGLADAACDPDPVAYESEGQSENLPQNVGLNFTADSGTRVTGGSVPCIVKLPSGVYRLFYNYNGEIYSASSTDGLNFTVDPGKRVAKGGTTDPDRDSAGNPVLIQFGENSFVLFYEGASGNTRVVLSATSTDGLNFTKQSGVRYSGTSADGGIVSAFDIIKESSTFLRMYYIGDWFGKNNVRTAVSADGGNTWIYEQGNICGDDNAGGGPNTYIDPDIVKLPSGGYKLYVKKGADKIYSFSSTDGLAFTQDSGVRLQASQFSSL
jgi:hypothetical protein